MLKDNLIKIMKDLESAENTTFNVVEDKLSEIMRNYYSSLSDYYRNMISKNEIKALKKVLKDDRLVR